MLFKYTVMKETYEELKPGDEVVLDFNPNYITKVVKVVESKKQIYAVFATGEWRPISTYGKTWSKLGVN